MINRCHFAFFYYIRQICCKSLTDALYHSSVGKGRDPIKIFRIRTNPPGLLCGIKYVNKTLINNTNLYHLILSNKCVRIPNSQQILQVFINANKKRAMWSCTVSCKWKPVKGNQTEGNCHWRFFCFWFVKFVPFFKNIGLFLEEIQLWIMYLCQYGHFYPCKKFQHISIVPDNFTI